MTSKEQLILKLSMATEYSCVTSIMTYDTEVIGV